MHSDIEEWRENVGKAIDGGNFEAFAECIDSRSKDELSMLLNDAKFHPLSRAISQKRTLIAMELLELHIIDIEADEPVSK